MKGKNEKKPKAWDRTQAYRHLKKAMLDDLEARGLVGPQFDDQVDTYMELWITKQALREDIRTRGVAVAYQNGTSQRGTTDNKSVDKLIRVSAQMLQIWSALGYKEMANNDRSHSGDEDDEL